MGLLWVKMTRNRRFQHVKGLFLVQVFGRCAEDPPPHERSRVVLLHVIQEADRRGVPPARPHSALNFKGDFMLRQGVVKTPFADGVKPELLYAVLFQVCLADYRENVTQRLFCGLLCRFILLCG